MNNDPRTTTIKTIQVLAPADRKPSPTLVIPEPVPVIPVAATPAPPIISDQAFHQLLLQLLEGKKPAEELMKYLCNQQETVVIINDKETTSFLQCCAQLQHKKNIRLISLSLARSKQGCIEALRIRYDKKKFIGLF
ncbi:hypothetical protein [Chitinophaga jiangningensis]|uniref:hypothetical protein n=1 Tax=Chitinophaga jiangningensis TaxID=1419482 RepID=UPI001160B6C5|nr:hypothetical protein [Chitinophaga jiangningensis]